LINYLIFDEDKVFVLIENIFDLNIILFIKSPNNNSNNNTNSEIEKIREVL